MTVDLHTHTTISDGKLDPRDLVRAAARAGIRVLAVTDHDTTEAMEECLDEGRKLGLQVVPGIEISSFTHDPAAKDPAHAERNLHVLAYFSPERLSAIFEWQNERRAAREERLDRMIERLAELGAPLRREDVTGKTLDPRRSIGRAHVARALVARGHVADQREAFERFLGMGKPAYVDYPRPSAGEVCALVRRLAGVAVVAHPGLDDLEPCLESLKECGIAGVEVFHPDHSQETMQRFLSRARALDLLATGGSDFHAGQKSEGGALGSVSLPGEHWLRLEEALARVAKAEGAGEKR
ncbi:PHP domain-containing protein [bacterium]|nr:PHP domain-containing protein [bacterium]